MKRALLALLLAVALTLGCVAPGLAQEVEQPEATAFYGIRLQSDMLLYVQLGFKTDNLDGTLGIGWNNSLWMGLHGYFFKHDYLSVFSGLELHIEYPNEETIEFHPALPLGFCINVDTVMVVVETLILPSLEGEPVEGLFALSIFFSL